MIHFTTKIIVIGVITISTMAKFLYNLCKIKMRSINNKNAVLITGCDSGLGYSFARHCHELGMTVFSCVLNEESLGAKDLKQRKDTHVMMLDITKEDSIKELQIRVNKIVTSQQFDFLGIVNNAGVMVFGEFEWLTQDQIENQIKVNFLGTVHLTKAFLPMLRKYKGRIINVSSHCSKLPLPALSIYSASKAAIEAWTSSIRMELEKFGIHIVSFIPGSYITQSNIMLRHNFHKENMKQEMTSDVMKLYGGYFDRFHNYIESIPSAEGLIYIQDEKLISKFDLALLSIKPNITYINSPLRYQLYHFIIGLAPWINMRNYFIRKYVNLPKW